MKIFSLILDTLVFCTIYLIDESSTIMKKLIRKNVGCLPLIRTILERMNIRDILCDFFPRERNEKVPVPDTIILLIYNLTIGKEPLYHLKRWVESLNLQVIGLENYSHIPFTDDRFAKALDKIYQADRASLMTRIVLVAINAFEIDLSQIHNDSTTVKAYGKYPHKTTSGFSLEHGKSKDHRPDLKQLLFTLTISADGAVPIHHKTYPGNRTDDKTHIETWKMIRQLVNSPDFLYVADCKLCTDEQLEEIADTLGGRALTIIPKSWKEVQSFLNDLREKKKPKIEIHRKKNLQEDRTDYYYVFEGDHFTIKRGYRIHWIFSTQKQFCDRIYREQQLQKVEKKLESMQPKLNKRNLKKKEDIKKACEVVLKEFQVVKFIKIDIGEVKESYTVQVGRGRPSSNTKYKTVINTIYVLDYSRNKEALKKEENIDGVFPLLSTNKDLSARDALLAYKYQPRLEKRFTQFKSIHNAAPLLFKKIERIEANMFIFFIALMVQALIEREVRNKMKENELPELEIYPENRTATHPTTSKVFEVFQQLSKYTIVEGEEVSERYQDDLNFVQKTILEFLDIDERQYWNGNCENNEVCASCIDGTKESKCV